MFIEITVDTNDADYLTKVSEIPDEDLELIKPLINKVKAFKPYTTKRESHHITRSMVHTHNYPYDPYGDEECARTDLGEKTYNELYEGVPEEVFDIFNTLCPCGEYGFHSIMSITVYERINVDNLL